MEATSNLAYHIIKTLKDNPDKILLVSTIIIVNDEINLYTT